MNRWIGSGRLTKDPEIRYTQQQTAIATFAVAVDRWKEGTDFFTCKAFGKTAEHIDKYWHKGMKALITGRLQQDVWTDKNGDKKQAVVILVDEIEFCEKKGETQTTEATEWAPVPAGNDEELPFKF